MNRFFRIRLVYPDNNPTGKTTCSWNYQSEKAYQRGLKNHVEQAKRLARYGTKCLISEENIDGEWSQFDSWTSSVPTAEEQAALDKQMREEYASMGIDL